MPILTTVIAVLAALTQYEPLAEQVIKTGMNLFTFGEYLYKQLKGEELTEDERTALRAAVDAQFAQFMRPQSPAQPGDPDYIPPAA